MKLYELVRNCDTEQVLQSLVEDLFVEKDNLEGYEIVLEKLKIMQPVESDDPVKIIAEIYDPKEDPIYPTDDPPYWSVSGIKENDDIHWALEFTPWEEWLSSEVFELCLAKHPHHKIVAACLWEMTFCGYDQDDIKDQVDDLKNRVRELEEDLLSGDMSKYKTLDEVLKELEEELEDENLDHTS